MYLCMEKQTYTLRKDDVLMTDVFRRISQNRFTSHPQNQKKEIINDVSQQEIVESALFLQYRLIHINRNITESMMQTSSNIHFLEGKSNFSFVIRASVRFICQWAFGYLMILTDHQVICSRSADRNSCLLFCNAAFVFCARPQCIWPRVLKLVCVCGASAGPVGCGVGLSAGRC